MKKIIYVDAETFEQTEQQFDDSHFELTESIVNFLTSSFQKGSFITNAIGDKDGKKLIIGVIKNRKDGETVAEKYRITIEKI